MPVLRRLFGLKRRGLRARAGRVVRRVMRRMPRLRYGGYRRRR